ncbi:hypothetical protein SAMN04487958_107167 [Vreelandella subterranea]|uniref:Uncharacterized protein n=1 Tax=Vreelandella subterranea TaxID=416874 RepID=A0A1H9URB5_9GAMM|nr:hypothetical protein [Halomonas subterranea]SES11879.1 hypothetical protein SAMN04487958_107167 [Halomonas subterranea]
MDDTVFTDEEISTLLSVEKRVQNPRAHWKEQKGSRQRNYKLVSACGKHFEMYIRQNMRIEDAFSCGLRFIHPKGKEHNLTLCRYNGSDHTHSNPLESSDIIHERCHIHRATHRYIQAGRKPEHYAETTDRYTSLEGAIEALCHDCSIIFPDSNPLSDVHNDLFGGSPQT